MGVKDPGKGLVAPPHKDGLIEVLEQPDKERFLDAMQFHPEMMAPEHPHFYKIFEPSSGVRAYKKNR